MKRIRNLEHRGGYSSPMITVAEFAIEAGFAVSGTGSAGWEDGSEENNMGNF